MQECVTQECKDAKCEKITMQLWEQTGAPVPVCSVYVRPKVWWRRGGCPIIYKHVEEHKGKKRVGQQKGKRKR